MFKKLLNLIDDGIKKGILKVDMKSGKFYVENRGLRRTDVFPWYKYFTDISLYDFNLFIIRKVLHDRQSQIDSFINYHKFSSIIVFDSFYNKISMRMKLEDKVEGESKIKGEGEIYGYSYLDDALHYILEYILLRSSKNVNVIIIFVTDFYIQKPGLQKCLLNLSDTSPTRKEKQIQDLFKKIAANSKSVSIYIVKDLHNSPKYISNIVKCQDMAEKVLKNIFKEDTIVNVERINLEYLPQEIFKIKEGD